MSAALALAHVTKRFGGLVAVHDVSVEIAAGQITGLIGPNGAGKTVLFRIVSGHTRPSSGTVFHDGVNITGWSLDAVARRGVCATHQIVRPFAELTVLENVLVAATFGGGARLLGAAPRAEAEDVLEVTGLAAWRDAPASVLTLAMRKRLEIARALATRPSLLLLDEALAGLTPAESQQAVALVRRLRDREITIVMIEHVMRAVMDLSDRVLVLNYGRLIADGTPTAVTSDPRVIEAYLGRPDAAPRP